MSNQESLLNLLGDFFTKSHRELSTIFEPLLRRSEDRTFFTFEVTGPEKTRVTAQMKANDIVFTATSENRAFEIKVPTSPERAEEATITMTTVDEGGQPRAINLRGADILDVSRIPDSFRELHAKLVKVISQALPVETFSAFTGRQASESSPSTPAENKVSTGEATHEPTDEYVDVLIERENEPNLRFRGKLVAGARSYPRQGRTHILKVYTTPGGKFVGVRQGLSVHWGERTRIDAKVADSAEALVELFGHNPLAKAIYAQLGINTDVVIA